MDRAMDLAQRMPTEVLLVVLGLSVLVPLLIGGIIGGWLAAVAMLIGLLALLGSGALLALKVHIRRLPLQLSDHGARGRLDGHPSYHFRVQLGLGRRMDQARARVRYLPDHGEPVPLSPLMERGERLFGPWTLVVVDREGKITAPGRFEVQVTVNERSRTWETERIYPVDAVVDGRFVPMVGGTSLTRSRTPTRFDAIEPATRTP